MHPVDGPLDMIWTLMMGQADSQWILGPSSNASSRWTTEYYLDVKGELGKW